MDCLPHDVAVLTTGVEQYGEVLRDVTTLHPTTHLLEPIPPRLPIPRGCRMQAAQQRQSLRSRKHRLAIYKPTHCRSSVPLTNRRIDLGVHAAAVQGLKPRPQKVPEPQHRIRARKCTAVDCGAQGLRLLQRGQYEVSALQISEENLPSEAVNELLAADCLIAISVQLLKNRIKILRRRRHTHNVHHRPQLILTQLAVAVSVQLVESTSQGLLFPGQNLQRQVWAQVRHPLLGSIQIRDPLHHDSHILNSTHGVPPFLLVVVRRHQHVGGELEAAVCRLGPEIFKQVVRCSSLDLGHLAVLNGKTGGLQQAGNGIRVARDVFRCIVVLVGFLIGLHFLHLLLLLFLLLFLLLLLLLFLFLLLYLLPVELVLLLPSSGLARLPDPWNNPRLPSADILLVQESKLGIFIHQAGELLLVRHIPGYILRHHQID
mmetsp:Transcript_43698/g.95240  ORF Transcript_43698/g.95240 Transcript_43698/m.95240 type:complete len:430 (+) Transcript_43698:1106-2395(+)